jgi:hypothetical protein
MESFLVSKNISTLIQDIYEVIRGHGGWDQAASKYLGDTISKVSFDRFSKPQEPRGYLSLSSIGTPCQRKLWYKVNEPHKGEPLGPETLGTFFYGDMIEALVIALAKASGHTVEGEQETLNVHGIKGHQDCIIDGMVVDVKSASSYSFDKFASGSLRENDPFGYISQLSSYLYAGKDDPRVLYKSQAAFLVVKKDRFKLCLDRYDFTEELKTKEQEIEDTKIMVKGPQPQDRISPVPQSKTSPNMVLDTQCGYCEFRKDCWPEARTFLYSNGPVFMTSVVTLPKVTELIE